MASAGFLLGKEESVCLLPPIIKTDETTKTAATVRILASVKWMEIRGTDVHFHESSPNNHIHILRNSVSYCSSPFVFIQCPLKFPVAHLITYPPRYPKRPTHVRPFSSLADARFISKTLPRFINFTC